MSGAGSEGGMISKSVSVAEADVQLTNLDRESVRLRSRGLDEMAEKIEACRDWFRMTRDNLANSILLEANPLKPVQGNPDETLVQR